MTVAQMNLAIGETVHRLSCHINSSNGGAFAEKRPVSHEQRLAECRSSLTEMEHVSNATDDHLVSGATRCHVRNNDDDVFSDFSRAVDVNAVRTPACHAN
jgi:hypothetical protein